MSTQVFVAPGNSTQADGAQSSRVPVPLPEDPCEAIRQAYLDGMDTESEPFEDPVEIETPESPLTIAPHISLSESTPPVLDPILRRTARMAVRVPPAMSSGLSASMAEVAAMSESVFCKRFRSSYKSSPYLSPPDLPSRKRYQGTSELVEDSEEDDDEEDKEIEESMDSDSVSGDAEDEGPTVEDEDPAAGDEGLTARVEALGMDDESYGLDDESHGMDDESRGLDDEDHGVESDGLGLEEEEEAVHGGQQQVASVVRTAVSTPLGLGYGELRRRDIALEEDQVYSTFETDLEDSMVYIDVSAYPPLAPLVQTPPSPVWTSATLTTTETEGFLTELGAQVKIEGRLIRDHVVLLEELSPALFERERTRICGYSLLRRDMRDQVCLRLLTAFLYVRDVRRTTNSGQLLWEFKSIGNSSNFGNDLERSNLSRVKLSSFAKNVSPLSMATLLASLCLPLETQGVSVICQHSSFDNHGQLEYGS
ncbi:hypothetical protein Tco_0935903 [Tanacetum coccineum]